MPVERATGRLRMYSLTALLLTTVLRAAPAAWSQQSVPVPASTPGAAAPAVAQTPSDTPAAPAVPEKKKKKPKAPPPPPAPPVAPDQMCAVTFHVQGMSMQSTVSDVHIQLSGDGARASQSGTTDSSGDFRTSMAPGDYDMVAEQGTLSVRQTVHVNAGGAMTVIVTIR